MADDLITQALKEIGFCDDLRVKVREGVIVAICKQVIQRPERAGIRTQHIIEEDITK